MINHPEEFHHILEINHHNIYLGSGKITNRIDILEQHSIVTIISISQVYYDLPHFPNNIKHHV